ncbi:MAG: TlpA disulfide reductase family protein [Gammaproteobacteria bacterium]
MNLRTVSSVLGLSLARRALVAAAFVALTAVPAVPAFAAANTGPAPDFVLDSNTGKPVKLSGYKGQVVMINFWATWCGPCREEMPLLESIYKQYKNKNFTLLSVNVEPDSKGATDWLKKTPVTFPVLFDVKSDVSNLYKVAVMPSSYFVDKKGNLRVIHRGYKSGDENEYMSSIRMLMLEK